MTGPTHSNRMQSQATCSRIHSRSEFVRMADQAKFQRCCTIILEHGDTVGPRLALERNTQGEQSSKHFVDRQRKHQTHLGTTIPSLVGVENWQASRGTGHLSLGNKNPDMYQKRDPIFDPNNDPNSGVAHHVFVFGSVPKTIPKLGPTMRSFFNPNPDTNLFTMAKLCSEAVPG